MSLPPKLIIILSNIDILRLVMKISGHSSKLTLMNTSTLTRDTKRELLCWHLNNKYSIKYLLNKSFRKNMNCLVSNIKHQISIRANKNDLLIKIMNLNRYGRLKEYLYNEENKVFIDYLKDNNLECILMYLAACLNYHPPIDKQKHVNLLSVQGMSSTSAYGCLHCSERPGY